MIVITDKYAIKSDKHQWMICEYRKATEKYPAKWEPVKYYVALAPCIDALRGILLRTSDYESFNDLTRNLREINKLLDKKLKVTI